MFKNRFNINWSKYSRMLLLLKDERIQLILIISFLIWSFINYAFITSTATVGFITVKICNYIWENWNEKYFKNLCSGISSDFNGAY